MGKERKQKKENCVKKGRQDVNYIIIFSYYIMDNLTQGMGAMSVSAPTTPRGQGTTAVNLQPVRPKPNNHGKGGPGKKLHYGYQQNAPGGRRKRRSRKRRKSRRKSRKRRKRTKKRRRRRRRGGAVGDECTSLGKMSSSSSCGPGLICKVPGNPMFQKGKKGTCQTRTGIKISGPSIGFNRRMNALGNSMAAGINYFNGGKSRRKRRRSRKRKRSRKRRR